MSLLRRLLIAVLFGSLAILGLAPASTSAAGLQHSPKVVPPQGHPYGLGRTYGQWNAQWWRWLYQTPFGDNVVMSGQYGAPNAPAQVDCSTGQHGKVWFLGGTFLPTSSTPQQVRSDVYRSCSIPAGTALFFPLLNTEFDNLGCPNTTFTARQLRRAARTGIDDVVPGSLSATIDGKSVRGLNRPDTKYRAPSPWFSYRLPTDNVTQLIPCHPPLPEGSRPPPVNGHAGAVADGIYVMLAPLRPGTHTIHFGGELSVPATPAPAPPLGPINFVQNINYTITVTHHR